MLRRLTSSRLLESFTRMSNTQEDGDLSLQDALNNFYTTVLTQQHYFSPHAIQQAKGIRDIVDIIRERDIRIDQCDVLEDIIDRCQQVIKQRTKKKYNNRFTRKFNKNDDFLKDILLRVRALVFSKTYGLIKGETIPIPSSSTLASNSNFSDEKQHYCPTSLQSVQVTSSKIRCVFPPCSGAKLIG